MVLEKVKAILSEQFDVEEDSITADTSIADDLGADSLDVVDLLMSIEDEFEIEIPDEEIDNIKGNSSSTSKTTLTRNPLLTQNPPCTARRIFYLKSMEPSYIMKVTIRKCFSVENAGHA